MATPDPKTAPFKVVLLGHPVGHSRSAEIFGTLAGVGGPRVDYRVLDVLPHQLLGVLQRLRDGEWDAANVTVPHKLDAAAAMDELDPWARAAGAVNVIQRHGGRLLGANTDGPGFLAGLGAMGEGIGTATVLGAGGAARGVSAALVRAGVAVTLISRDPIRLSRGDRRPGARLPASRVLSWGDPGLEQAIGGCDLLVQATPRGMEPRNENMPPVPTRCLRPGQRVVDLIYAPWETRLLREARQRGAIGLNGWPMLVGQAAAAADRWFGPGAGQLLTSAATQIEVRNPKKAVRSVRPTPGVSIQHPLI